jgi:hypothetical protein
MNTITSKDGTQIYFKDLIESELAPRASSNVIGG